MLSATRFLQRSRFWLAVGIGISLVSCQLEDPEVGLVTDELISLSLSDSVLVADGVSILQMTATLGPESSPNQYIEFQTEAGTLESASQDQQSLSIRAAGREAEAVLVSSTEVRDRVSVSAQVSATENNETYTYQARGTVAFVRAYPDELSLSLANRSIPAAVESQTALTVSMFRTVGTVSNGTRLFFQVAPIPGDSVDVAIDPFVFADTDQATATITNLDTIPGTVLITTWILDEQGDTAIQAQTTLPILE